ncbi:ATP-binding protein [Bacteroidota bacterium]
MNSLLKRQIRKYLNLDHDSEELKPFLNAVERSYETYDDQFSMLQRATAISSDELFTANAKLIKESESQKELIGKLRDVIDTLKFYGLEGQNSQDDLEVNSTVLIDFIEDKTKEIIEINKQKDKLLNSLELQNQELSDYAHMVSHDLKSPLRAIETLTTWLNEDYSDKLGEDGKNNLIHIKNNVKKMDELISGILEYSTIGKTEINIVNIDLNEVVQETLKTLYNPDNVVITAQRLPEIKGNIYRLQQLFQNIIDNAIKYNDKEQGTVHIGYEDYNKTHYKFYIKDNGKGIDKKHFDKIFKTFNKLESDTHSSGIGLSIVKKIVTLHEGQIWVESKLNTGTTFYFTLKKSKAD